MNMEVELGRRVLFERWGGGVRLAPHPLSLRTKMYHNSMFPFLCKVFVAKMDGSFVEGCY